MQKNSTTATRNDETWTGAGFPENKIPIPEVEVIAGTTPTPASVTVQVPIGDVVEVVPAPVVSQ